MTDRPLTVAEVAERENVSAKTVLRAIARGDLDAWNVGDPDGMRPTWRIEERAIASWRARARERRRLHTARAVNIRPVEPEVVRPARPRAATALARGHATVTPDMGKWTAA